VNSVGAARSFVHLGGFFNGASQWLFANHVLAGLKSGNRDLGVKIIRGCDVNQVDLWSSMIERQSLVDFSKPNRAAASAASASVASAMLCLTGKISVGQKNIGTAA
jgi:hypothetical protein